MTFSRSGWSPRMLAIAIITTGALLTTACEPESHPVRGYVRDQDTQAGIAGAIVLAQYFGRGGDIGHNTCDRIESTVSDANGYYELPSDPRTDLPILTAYAPGYFYGRGQRRAAQLDPEQPTKWQIVQDTWNEANNRATTVAVEPQVYSSQREAQWASGEFRDVFLRRSRADAFGRLQELRVMTVPGYCEGESVTSHGAVPYLEAILAEQIQRKALEQDIRMTSDEIRMAKESTKR